MRKKLRKIKIVTGGIVTSILIAGSTAFAQTIPYVQVKNPPLTIVRTKITTIPVVEEDNIPPHVSYKRFTASERDVLLQNLNRSSGYYS